MEQRQTAAEVFVDDGVGGTGDRLGYTKTRGKAAGERGLARAKVAVVGENIARLQLHCQLAANGFRLFRTVGLNLHDILPVRYCYKVSLFTRL